MRHIFDEGAFFVDEKYIGLLIKFVLALLLPNFVTTTNMRVLSYNHMKTRNIISKNIKDLRVKYSFTQSFIAEYLGVTPAAVSQYESDARTIPPQVIEKLAMLFNIQEHALFEENPDKHILNCTFAFRSGEFSPEDLRSITKFKTIVYNYINMKSALDGKP